MVDMLKFTCEALIAGKTSFDFQTKVKSNLTRAFSVVKSTKPRPETLTTENHCLTTLSKRQLTIQAIVRTVRLTSAAPGFSK